MYSENMVDQTEVCVKQPSPNHSYRCRSRYHRQEENGTVYASALHLPVQKDCQHQRDGNGKRHLYDCIFDRIDQRLPYLRICKHCLIIFQSHKDISPAEVSGLKEALIDCLENRYNIQNNKSQHRRNDKRPAPSEFAALTACYFLFRLCHMCHSFFLWGQPPKRLSFHIMLLLFRQRSVHLFCNLLAGIFHGHISGPGLFQKLAGSVFPCNGISGVWSDYHVIAHIQISL